jgi:hypothetical protein
MNNYRNLPIWFHFLIPLIYCTLLTLDYLSLYCPWIDYYSYSSLLASRSHAPIICSLHPFLLDFFGIYLFRVIIYGLMILGVFGVVSLTNILIKTKNKCVILLAAFLFMFTSLILLLELFHTYVFIAKSL